MKNITNEDAISLQGDDRIIYAGTIEEDRFGTIDATIELQILNAVGNCFKYGYGGYNGWYKAEVLEEIRNIVSHAIQMSKYEIESVDSEKGNDK